LFLSTQGREEWKRKKFMGTKTPSKLLHRMTDFDLLGAVQTALLQKRAVSLGEERIDTHPQK